MPVVVELDDSGEHIIINAEWRYKELCKAIPGSNWHKESNMWRLPASWAGCLALRTTFRSELQIGPKLTEWATHELNSRVVPANTLREVAIMDEGDPDLFPHQRAGVAFLVAARRALLADEPGLGKSAQAIRALKAIQESGEDPFPALIVCPNTLKTNWEREFQKWWPEVRVQVIGGTATQRRKQFDLWFKAEEDEPKPQVFVVNWESLRTLSRLASYGNTALAKCRQHGGEDERISAARCEVHLRELNQINFNSVIADEIHRSKDPKAKQTRALWAATGDAKNRFALTGTPIATDVADMWSILHWLSPEEWPSKSKWIDRMVDTLLNAFGGLHILGLKPEMRDEFYGAVNPRMRRMLKQIVLPFLPPVLHEERFVEMSAKQKKAYGQMRDFMIAELENGDTLMAPSPLTQMTRLLQFSVAYAEMEVDPQTGESFARLSEPSATVDAVMNDILSGDFGDDSIAVSSVSRQLLELLSARLTKAGINHGMITGGISPDVRQKSIDEFQSGQVKYILFTVQAGGVGVTLTKARRLLRLLRPYSLVDDKQANDRVHRIGSEIHDSIMITDYIVQDTVQERVQEVLENKEAHAEEIVRDRDQLLNMLKKDKAKK